MQHIQLPNHSIMHAIRLAEQRKLTSIKQRLFDSISIDVFRYISCAFLSTKLYPLFIVSKKLNNVKISVSTVDSMLFQINF